MCVAIGVVIFISDWMNTERQYQENLRRFRAEEAQHDEEFWGKVKNLFPDEVRWHRFVDNWRKAAR